MITIKRNPGDKLIESTVDFTESEKSYLAGFFDAEGSIVIYHGTEMNYRQNKNYDRWSLQVTIGNRHEESVRRFSARFGGRVSSALSYKAFNEGQDKIFYCILQKGKAAGALRCICPYLKVKNVQAECGINFQETFSMVVNRKAGLSKEVKETRESLRKEVRKLNARYNNRVVIDGERLSETNACHGSNNFIIPYLAGFFDGDGTLAISHYKRRGNKNYESWGIGVTVANHCKVPIDLFQKSFGGSLRESRDHRSCRFTVTLSSRLAVDALKQMIPYLVVKRDQAKVAIEFQDRKDSVGGFQHSGLPESERNKREEMRREIRRLNGLCNSRSQRAYVNGEYK